METNTLGQEKFISNMLQVVDNCAFEYVDGELSVFVTKKRNDNET